MSRFESDFDDMFERSVADQELSNCLDDEFCVPTDAEIRTARAFGASRDLLYEAQRRRDVADGFIDENEAAS